MLNFNIGIHTDLDFYQHLVKHGFISRKSKHSDGRKVKIIKKLIKPGRSRHSSELSQYRLDNNKVVGEDKDEHDAFVKSFDQKNIPDILRGVFIDQKLTLSEEAKIQIKKKSQK